MAILALAVAVLILLIVKKVNPMLALLAVSILAGLLYGMPVTKLIASISNGIGSTLGSILIVLAVGAMIGKIAEESGSAQKLVHVLSNWFGIRNIQWALLCTGLLAGIPLFYNAGFVVLIPLVYAVSRTTRLPLLWVGLPMVAALSVTHGFLPPHPGPVALAAIFKADIGRLLFYGLIIALPVAVIAGILYPRLVIKKREPVWKEEGAAAEEKQLPSAFKSFLVVLSPVVLIAAGTLGAYFTEGSLQSFFVFIREPSMALLISLAITIMVLDSPIASAMQQAMEGVKAVSMILLIIAAGGAFKQVLEDSHIGDTINAYTESMQLSPLLFAWLVAAVFRMALGSATVAGLTASGIVLPLLTPGVSPELMVLSVGAGSIMCSHVNDTGFWMFKEYFGLSVKETFRTWTVMESLISVAGLVGVLVLDLFV